MSSLIGAVDETKDGEYLAFIICDNVLVERNRNVFENGLDHMSNPFYDRDTKQQIINNLDLSGNTLACCIKFGIPQIKEYQEKSGRNISSAKCYRKTSYRIKSTLNTIYANFLVNNRTTIQDIVFEVDNNTIRSFLRPAGLQCTSILSELHNIADCIAYANLKEWKLDRPNLIEKGENFRQYFLKIIKNDLSK